MKKQHTNSSELSIYLLSLLELHNLVSLLNEHKKQYRKSPTQDNKLIYQKTAIALKNLNDKINLYADEYIYLNEIVQNSTYDKEILIIDNRSTPIHQNFLLRQQTAYLRAKKQEVIIITEKINQASKKNKPHKDKNELST